MLIQFSSSTEALRLFMIMTLGALGLFIKDSSQPKLLLLLPLPTPVDSLEAPICIFMVIKGAQASGGERMTAGIHQLASPPHTPLKASQPNCQDFSFLSELCPNNRCSFPCPFYHTGSLKEQECPFGTMVTHKKQNEESQGPCYPNLHQKLRGLRSYEMGPRLQGKPAPYVIDII